VRIPSFQPLRMDYQNGLATTAKKYLDFEKDQDLQG